MRNFGLLCWYLWEGLPTLLAFPLDSSKILGSGDFRFSHWENHWPRYAIGTLGFVGLVLTLVGCLCCRRQRRPKGFQDDAETGKEFKDGSGAATETTIERLGSSSLELEVPRILGPISFNEKIPNDEDEVKSVEMRKALKPPSSSSFIHDETTNDLVDDIENSRTFNDWYEGENFPRERLKYLREIGRGWFGKVVEGTALQDDEENGKMGKNRGVVVRILTEEATSREKSWFLGESTPYLKLRHENILKILGCCLETDPYLLLFESCPTGDLKNFLITNRDNAATLREKNLPILMALNILDALEHMHKNGFSHTDLSTRNCLVAHDLTAKLGDYGTGVEKYPDDYYVVGDRALPIRWSAPESLECTKTTIETRAITPAANIWSYGILLWEIENWGERPYNDHGDELIIEIIFSDKSATSPKSSRLLDKLLDNVQMTKTFRDAIIGTYKYRPEDRSSLERTRKILCGKEIENFDERWQNLRPNIGIATCSSLKDLREKDPDDESWQGNANFTEKVSGKTDFRLGEPVNTSFGNFRESSTNSGSETEEESWRGRVERGAYTEKVKQKSKSVADLMILVHIDSDSDLESSLGPLNYDKTMKKRLPSSGSDGDLRSAVIADEFDEALRKLREPSTIVDTSMKNPQDSTCNFREKMLEKTIIHDNQTENSIIHENLLGNAPKTATFDENSSENMKMRLRNSKLLTLTNQGETPILRLSFGLPETLKSTETTKIPENSTENLNIAGESVKNEKHVLRLLSKGNPDLPLLRYAPERTSTPENNPENSTFDSFLVLESRETEKNGVSLDVELWNNALSREMEKKNASWMENGGLFEETNVEKNYFTDTRLIKNDYDENISKSAPDTPKTWKRDYSVLKGSNDSTSGSSSAPVTPGKTLTDSSMVKIEDSRKNLNYDVDDDDPLTGSTSAPETPFPGDYIVPNNDEDSSACEELEERMIVKDSAPDTPQSRGNYSVGNCDEDSSSTGEELDPGIIKRSSNDPDDEERKHLSTPDDERSSDSGFRDKESCEEEESPIPGHQSTSLTRGNNASVIAEISSPLSASAEEEQMRILFELDTILDAEYYGSFNDDGEDNAMEDVENINFSNDDDDIIEKIRSISESRESTDTTEIVCTVRANSCEPHFLDNLVENNDETSRDAKYEIDDISIDLLENTDSISEFLKYDESRSNSKKDDFIGDTIGESPIKINKQSETSIEISQPEMIDSSSLSNKTDQKDFPRSDSPKNCEKSDLSSSSINKGPENCETSEKSSSSLDKMDLRDLSRGDYSENLDKMEKSSSAIVQDDREGLEKSCSVGKVSNRDFSAYDDSENLDKTENLSEDFSPIDISENLEKQENSSSFIEKSHQRDFPLVDTSENSEKMENSFSSGAKENRSDFHCSENQSNSENSYSLGSKVYQGEFSLMEMSENSSSSVDKEDRRDIPQVISESRKNPEDLSTSVDEVHRREVALEKTSNNSSSPVDKEDRDAFPPESPENCVEAEKSSSSIDKAHDDGTTNDSTENLSCAVGNADCEIFENHEISENRQDESEISENANENDDEDSSTMSLRSDNSYVSFGLDEEFVAAIRNELREKLPRAQMPVVEALDPHDEQETASINPETTKNWNDDDDDNSERNSVDIAIRYNIYGTPLSPIMEERESAGTSESLVSKDDSRDASLASRVSALSEDVLVVDTRTNRAIIVQAGTPNTENPNSQHDDDRDTSHGDFSDEENLEYPQNHLNRSLENKRISMGSGGAPLPSPEEESKWQQQFPLPLQMQDDLMSTSFGTDRDWDSQDDEEGEDEAEDGEEDEEENSSSSGEFVWKRYDESHGDLENVATRSPPNKPKSQEPGVDLDEEDEDGDEDDEEEEEFTPSAWDATLAPHRSALRSPEKTLKSGDQKKSVWFKKQRYHCVYEYPKETPIIEGQSSTTWEPTSYADWEEMMDEPRLDIYPMDYEETHRAGDEEFYVSSSNRPFQFQSGEGKYVSQFFPGATSTLFQQNENHHQGMTSVSSSSSSSLRDTKDSTVNLSQDEVDCPDNDSPSVSSTRMNGNSRGAEINESLQQKQLGELRHTRDRLKLNLLTTGGTTKVEEDVANDHHGEKTQENAGKLKENSDQPMENAENTRKLEMNAEKPQENEEGTRKPEENEEGTRKPEENEEGTRKPEENEEGTRKPEENEEGTRKPEENEEGTRKPEENEEGTRKPEENEEGTRKPDVDVGKSEENPEKTRENSSELKVNAGESKDNVEETLENIEAIPELKKTASEMESAGKSKEDCEKSTLNATKLDANPESTHKLESPGKSKENVESSQQPNENSARPKENSQSFSKPEENAEQSRKSIEVTNENAQSVDKVEENENKIIQSPEKSLKKIENETSVEQSETLEKKSSINDKSNAKDKISERKDEIFSKNDNSTVIASKIAPEEVLSSFDTSNIGNQDLSNITPTREDSKCLGDQKQETSTRDEILDVRKLAKNDNQGKNVEENSKGAIFVTSDDSATREKKISVDDDKNIKFDSSLQS